jgi:hypothetical protein
MTTLIEELDAMLGASRKCQKSPEERVVRRRVLG